MSIGQAREFRHAEFEAILFTTIAAGLVNSTMQSSEFAWTEATPPSEKQHPLKRVNPILKIRAAWQNRRGA
jgi:hypothetical protein